MERVLRERALLTVQLMFTMRWLRSVAVNCIPRVHFLVHVVVDVLQVSTKLLYVVQLILCWWFRKIMKPSQNE